MAFASLAVGLGEGLPGGNLETHCRLPLLWSEQTQLMVSVGSGARLVGVNPQLHHLLPQFTHL